MPNLNPIPINPIVRAHYADPSHPQQVKDLANHFETPVSLDSHSVPFLYITSPFLHPAQSFYPSSQVILEWADNTFQIVQIQDYLKRFKCPGNVPIFQKFARSQNT